MMDEGYMFRTGLESGCEEGAKFRDTGKFFPEAVEAESSECSIEGKGSRSLSRPRWWGS